VATQECFAGTFVSREAAKPRSRAGITQSEKVPMSFAGTFVKCLQRATCGNAQRRSSRLRVRLHPGEQWWLSAWLLWGWL